MWACMYHLLELIYNGMYRFVILHNVNFWYPQCVCACVYVCLCMAAHTVVEDGGEKLKLHSGASRLDTRSKYTHFLISHIGQPAAPQVSNNGLVITPR